MVLCVPLAVRFSSVSKYSTVCIFIKNTIFMFILSLKHKLRNRGVNFDTCLFNYASIFAFFMKNLTVFHYLLAEFLACPKNNSWHSYQYTTDRDNLKQWIEDRSGWIECGKIAIFPEMASNLLSLNLKPDKRYIV